MNVRDYVGAVVVLLNKGYLPYPGGHVPPQVYEERKCNGVRQSAWFVRPASEAHKNTRYQCLGCRKRCVLVDPPGFQAMLPVRVKSTPVLLMEARQLSARELVALGRPLRVLEAAWALNVSDSQMYAWIDEGLLERVPGTPLRVTADSVSKLMQPT